MGRLDKRLSVTAFVLSLVLSNAALTSPPIAAQELSSAMPASLYINDQSQTTADYHKLPVNLALPQAKEALVPISKFKIAGESFYKRNYKTADREARVRLSVAQKLQAANALLKAEGLEVYVLDGYRPLALQKELWQHFLQKAKISSPKKDTAALKQYAARYCSDPENFKISDSKTWPSHITGGAVDLTLRHIGGNQLDMGGQFDEDSQISHTAYYETIDKLSDRQAAARKYRRLLYNAMHAQGFENYPYEWWHYDFGDQAWASALQRQYKATAKSSLQPAFYGPAQDR